MICKCGNETGADWKTLCLTCWRNRAPEEIRAYRQAKLDRKLDRMEARASRLDRIGEEKTATFEHYRGDIAFLTQPASPASGFGKYRNRIMDRYTDGVEMQIEANEIREKAEQMRAQGAVVRGDAEARRQKQREALDRILTVGSRVHDFAFGLGTIERIFRKSYRVKYDRGYTYSREKTYLRPVKN